MTRAKAAKAVMASGALASLCLAGVAAADDAVSVGTVDVEAARAGEAAPVDDASGSVTVVDARAPSARVSSVAELVERQVGVQVRSRGGLGAFTAVSIRGSDPSEVAVYVDGVPLRRAGGGVVDLSQLPVDDLERVEIWRGAPPVELGGEAIGGVINLITRRASRAPTLRASLGVGSFGARSATLGWGGTTGGLRVDLAAGYHGATGDFLYYDDAGTLTTARDDGVARRRNDGFDQGSLDLTVGGGARTAWRVATHGFVKHQGVPGLGTAGAETLHAALETERLLVDADVRHAGEVDARGGVHLTLERTDFTNRDDEAVGNFGASHLEGQTLVVGLDGRVDAPIGGAQLVSVLGEADLERYAPADLLHPDASQPPSLRVRAAAALADEIRLARDRVALSPAVRVDAVANQLAAGQGTRAGQADGSSVSSVFVSPRLGARWRVARWLTVRGGVGRFVRLPALVELFGDGAFILPRPSLRPEVAVGGDLGVTLELAQGPRRLPLGLLVEAAGFGRSVADAIVLLPSARGLAADNVGSSTVLGAEARVVVRAGELARLSGNYTFLDARSHLDLPGAADHQLPNRARHQATARLDVGIGPFALFYEVQYQGVVYRDPQNRNPLPARTLHAVGLTVGPATRLGVTLTVEVRNLLDLRVTQLPLGGTAHAGETAPYPLVDVFDYPLPGRAAYATLALRTPLL